MYSDNEREKSKDHRKVDTAYKCTYKFMGNLTFQRGNSNACGTLEIPWLATTVYIGLPTRQDNVETVIRLIRQCLGLKFPCNDLTLG